MHNEQIINEHLIYKAIYIYIYIYIYIWEEEEEAKLLQGEESSIITKIDSRLSYPHPHLNSPSQ